MRDKRKIERRFLLYYMRVYDAATLHQIGNLVDITPRGIMVVSEHPLPEGQTTRLRMELTSEVTEKPFMEFSAHSKWCEPDIIPNMYNTGFEILDLAPEDAEIIQRIIEEFGFRDNKPEK
ncbi:MAG: PilZ domain-containing protein [Anaerolineales bacterium]